MGELKTKRNKSSVANFLNSVSDEKRRKDAKELLKIIRDITGEKPAMWGSSLVGFGSYHYDSTRSSQKGDWPLIAFSPRKQNLVVYVMPGVKKYSSSLKKLGKYKTGVSCLYINKLDDVNLPTLKTIIRQSYKDMKKMYLYN